MALSEVNVGRIDDLPPGSRKLVRVGNHEVGVFNVEGRLYAARNQCADQGGPVCTGGLFPYIGAEVGPDRRVREYLTDRGCIIACPWHGWEYDVRDGRCLWNSRYHLRMHAVRVDEAGNVLLTV